MMHLLEVSNYTANRARFEALNRREFHRKKFGQAKRIIDKLKQAGQGNSNRRLAVSGALDKHYNKMVKYKTQELNIRELQNPRTGGKVNREGKMWYNWVDDVPSPEHLNKPIKTLPPKSAGFLRKYKNPLIAGGLAAGVGGALLYKRMKNKKVQESASSCEFTTIAGPNSQDKRPIGSARKAQNLKELAKRRKRIYSKQGD